MPEGVKMCMKKSMYLTWLRIQGDSFLFYVSVGLKFPSSKLKDIL
jgi:hypothetical protein